MRWWMPVRVYSRVNDSTRFCRSSRTLFDDAVGAAGLAGDADGATVQDELVAKVDPVVFGNDLH